MCHVHLSDMCAPWREGGRACGIIVGCPVDLWWQKEGSLSLSLNQTSRRRADCCEIDHIITRLRGGPLVELPHRMFMRGLILHPLSRIWLLTPVIIQWWTLCCAPGSVNMRRKNCVFLPSAGRRTQFFLLIFMEPRAHHKVHPCKQATL